MQKAIQKAKTIQKTALAYKNDSSLSYRKAAQIHGIAPNSVINWYSNKTTPAPDYFIINQKISLIEEAVLIKYNMKYYK
jgi:intein-encoded DNA endonuclease-like protein